MATRRYYLPSSGAAAVSPAFAPYWTVTPGTVDRLAMSEAPADTVNAGKGGAETVSGNAHVLVRQFVGPADLPAGDVSGTFQTVIIAEENNSDANMFLDLVLKVVSSDGSTVRGILYNGQGTFTASPSSASPQYEFTVTSTRLSRTLSGTLSPVTALAGDRIVAEYGYSDNNLNTTGRTGTLHFGDQLADTDLAYAVDAGSSTTNRPWLDLILDEPIAPPATPTGLVATPDFTEIELDWTAGAGGDPADGFEVRIDGGAATDVGNVLTHTFTGLSPATAYTLEVRAYNAGGESAWASIGESTLGAPAAPTGLVATPTTTSIDLDWNASTGGPDGYEVRIDGGAITDVGNVLTHLFSPLYPATDHTLEVRAYNTAGASAWASIESTTLAAEGDDGSFTATITLGEHAWVIESGACDMEDPVQVLDSLKIGWEVSESDPWPAQPGALTCQLGLWTADVAEVADVSIGTPLAVVLTDLIGNTFATFHGRVARQSARIRKGGPGSLSMLYSLTAVDYTVDLAETSITISSEWPAESAADRMERVFDAITAAGAPMGTVPADLGVAEFAAYSTGTTTAAQLLEAHLSQIAVDSGDGLQRYIVAPVVTSDVLERFDVVLLERVVDASLLPGTLDVVDGLLTLVFPDMDANGIIDACIVGLDVSWNRLKYRAVNQVTVTGPDDLTATASTPGPPVRLNLQSTLTDADALQRMADLYLPDVDETNGWVADSFRFYAHRQPAALTPAWFPDHRSDPADTAVYVMPFAIVGIPANVNLFGETVYAGQLVKAELTIQRKRAYMEFSLRRQLPRSQGDAAITWDWIASEFPTITWDDIDPALSWYDVRLGRIP